MKKKLIVGLLVFGLVTCSLFADHFALMGGVGTGFTFKPGKSTMVGFPVFFGVEYATSSLKEIPFYAELSIDYDFKNIGGEVKELPELSLAAGVAHAHTINDKLNFFSSAMGVASLFGFVIPSSSQKGVELSLGIELENSIVHRINEDFYVSFAVDTFIILFDVNRATGTPITVEKKPFGVAVLPTLFCVYSL